ncbi:MAG TPA: NAD(P)H-dependent oxidoreductase [Planctomycetota bacterium]|nr:NAD(P)H-dependent oxidoreductase [Planctomycetota bacterium]
MAYTPRILAFAGSLRTGSFNKKLVQVAAAGARAAGADVTYVDLRDLPMPVFDEDLEAKDGLPPNARKFKDLLLAHQGLLISAPEYNSSITAVLKNAIDWASRPVPGEAPLGCFDGKVASLMAASPGALGGLRGLVTVRSILGNIKVIVLPDQIAVPKANEAFNPDGSLKDAKQQASVEKLGAGLVSTLKKLHG